MKRTEYFNSVEELNEYYPDGVPSTVLAIVQEEGSSEAVLFATSNNNSATGVTEDMGGYNLDEEDTEKLDYSYEFATTYGASKDYVATYVSTYGGGGGGDIDTTDYAYGYWLKQTSLFPPEYAYVLEGVSAIDILGQAKILEEDPRVDSHSYFSIKNAVVDGDTRVFADGQRYWDSWTSTYQTPVLTPVGVMAQVGILESGEEYDESTMEYISYYTTCGKVATEDWVTYMLQQFATQNNMSWNYNIDIPPI